MEFGRCIESYVVTVYAVNDTGNIYNALRKFGTLEFVRCMGENVVNGVRSNEVRLYYVILDVLIPLEDWWDDLPLFIPIQLPPPPQGNTPLPNYGHMIL